MKIVAASRLMYGWAALFALIAEVSLVSGTAVSDLAPKPVSIETTTPETTTPVLTPTPWNTPVTAPQNKIPIVTVGIIGKIDGDTISVQTLPGAIPVHLTVDSVVTESANSSPRDFAVGQRVTVMGQEGEFGFAALAAIVTLKSTSLFQDEGDFQIGEAVADRNRRTD